MGAVQIILIVLGVVEPMLAANGVIPTEYQPLAQGILNAINAVKSSLTGPNATVDVTTVSVTQAIASGLAALEAAKAIPTVGGGIATALAQAAAAGAQAYVAAVNKVDPTQVQPITPAS